MDKGLENLRVRMEKSLEKLSEVLVGLRAGRASARMLEPIRMQAYGAATCLNQVAGISAPESRLLSVHVWDPGLADAVEKAVRESGLGLNPIREGQVIRVPIPRLSEERRKELIRMVGKYAEQARIAIRSIRRDGLEGLKSEGLSKDEQHRVAAGIDSLTQKMVARAQEVCRQKEKDIACV